jgi:hypothetical protein
MSEQSTEQRQQSPWAEAGYAALGAGEAAVTFIRDLPNQWPQGLQYLREGLPATLRREFSELANRGRRLTGQLAWSPEALRARREVDETKETAKATVTGVRRTAEAERDAAAKAAETVDERTDPTA